MVSLDVPLPGYDELETQEIKLTAVPLIAAGMHLGKFCDEQCKVLLISSFELEGIHALPCRNLQYPFDSCIKEHLNMDRPEPGYFNRVRLHKTTRPKPEPGLAPMPKPLPDLPDFSEQPEPERMAQRRKVNDWLA
ncbi:hypothetical protein D915_001693 [Fasciola hepatica]|uniref:Uncharacterized protein n=1 Tax=Fasciola hepatica TaxID=6192 RepID=A0A4E0RP43_FASHE|nr:hypothetical protein D915_001693 [Fasciola hepatica]